LDTTTVAQIILPLVCMSGIFRPFLLAGLPDLSPFLLKAVFAWIPEYLFPELAIKGIPCPRCGGKGKPDGWSPKEPRRVFMEHDVAYIIGFR